MLEIPHVWSQTTNWFNQINCCPWRIETFHKIWLAPEQSFFKKCLSRFSWVRAILSYFILSILSLVVYLENMHCHFRTKQGPTVSVLNIRNIGLNRCSDIIWAINFTIFTMYATILENLQWLFIFSNYMGKIDHFTLDLLKRWDT